MKKTLTASFLLLTQLVWGQNIKENAFAKLGLQKPFVVIGLDTKDRIEVTSVTGTLLRQLKKFDNYQERVAIVAPNSSIASYLAEHDSIYHDLKTVFDAKLAVLLGQNKPNSSITLVGGEKVRQWQLSKMNDDSISSVISAMRAAGAPSAHVPVLIADAALAKRSVVSFDGQKAVVFDERNQKALIYDFASARHSYDFVKIDEQNFREVSLRLADGYELATPAETKRSLNSSSGKPPFNVSCYSAVQNASVARLVQVFRK